MRKTKDQLILENDELKKEINKLVFLNRILGASLIYGLSADGLVSFLIRHFEDIRE